VKVDAYLVSIYGGGEGLNTWCAAKALLPGSRARSQSTTHPLELAK